MTLRDLPHGVPTILAVALAAVILYGLGRWDRSLDDKVERWREEVERVLEMGNAFRARMAQVEAEKARLQAERDSIEAVEARLRREAWRIARADSIAREEAARTPVADLAVRLHLRPWTANEFIADSLVVRDLWATHLDRDLFQAENARLSSLVSNVQAQNTNLRQSLVLTESQLVTATDRISTLEATLRDGLRVTECKILGLFKCPSRGTMFILGGITGAVAVTTVVLATGGG